MNQELIEIKSCGEPGYHPLVYFGGWRVAFLNDTARFHLEQIREMQRHNTSDHVSCGCARHAARHTSGSERCLAYACHRTWS